MKRSTMVLGMILAILVSIPVGAQPVLSIDFNERGTDPATNTMPGFDSFLIDTVGSATAIQTAPSVRTFGGITVTLSGSGAVPGYDDRLRATPTNNATFTNGLLLRDVVFSRDNAGNDGLDVSITGLTPNQYYRITIWSFDTSSGGRRVSDWYASGTLVKENYTFDGRVLPTNNAAYQFSVIAAADNSGLLLIQGRRDSASVDTANVASFGVFINALQLEPTTPEPPVITTPLVSGIVNLGDRYVFAAVAGGTAPLSYQWFKGATEIAGATSSSLTLVNLTEADSGEYSIRVANLFGSATNSATLTVLPDPEPDVRKGLVSLWAMDTLDFGDPLGYSTPDSYSSNTLKLVSAGFFDLAPGKFGTALLFNGVNGSDQYGLRQGGFPIYNNSTFSVALWVNGTNQPDRRVFAESSTNLNNPLFTLGSEASGTNIGGVRVYIRNDAGTVLLDRTSARTAFDGNWHHVVWTETNGRGRLYIDGVLDNNSYDYTRGTITLDQTALAAILRTNAAALFNGFLDDAAVWSRVITLSEIQQIMTNGMPAPIGVVAPQVTQHPASQSVLTRTKVNFSFFATGTSPLEAQWRRFGTNVPAATNFTFTITNVALADAGDYDVVVANSAGKATSQVATLTITLRPDPPSELAIDFNNTGSETVVDTETGFLSFAIPQAGTGPFTRTYGGADVTLAAIGTTMESRLRTVPSNAVDFTEEKLLRDFVFTRDAADGQGLDVAIQFLEPNQPFTVSLWSFDSQSASRISDWYANGTLVRGGYAFVSTEMPISNGQYRFNFDVTSDAEGGILIQGRRNSSSATAINVFLNALRVVKSELRVLKIEFADFGDLRLTIQAINPAATHRVLQKATLTDPDWTDVPGVTFSAPAGNILQATFASPGQTQYYRVVQDP